MIKRRNKQAMTLTERATSLITTWIAETENETLSASLVRLRRLVVELIVEVEQQVKAEYEKVET